MQPIGHGLVVAKALNERPDLDMFHRFIDAGVTDFVCAPWMFVTVAVLLGHRDPKLGKWGTWLLSMIFGTLVGGGQGIVLLLVDAALLRYRVRLLPMGRRAWLMALSAPLLLFAAWHLWRPGSTDGALLWLAILGPMIAIALILRLLFSPRFH